MSNRRECEAIGCELAIAPGRFMCLAHWRAVPMQIRETVNTRYRLLRKDFAFLSDLEYLNACVVAIDGIAKAEGKDGVNPYRRHLLIAERRAEQKKAQS
ncbi:MAG: hypothetical protein V4451_05865 [Pseudomonadota bacterium]